ncbi:MAG: ketoacyl-ACP synthase III [Synergistaceae bacterium]|nr:ketoacyl-ACP synthase III [Synergistaceae bacterium]MBQ3626462.1 ketoacyl-ACP synthase III [Synergistaceae bacterium]MBQ7570022.1 ketoacyl-ACP synthase III [Synergistaceae bacterium]MBQ9582573.1 ketoacyl-ACP synthase III [Synergistaceae bacterium]MBQ9897659.1 ketoacyl-ACP synthase III [Synergistaceae bacterium]
MQINFKNKRIASILGVLPEQEYLFDDEVNNYSFPVRQTLRLKKVMGFNKHRLAKDSSCVSDFAVYAVNYMLENNWLDRDEIGAVIAVTLCPDYFVPHISNIVQAKCDLSNNILCLDIAQGCCGFLIGLMQSFMLLDKLENKKIILINGDVLSHKVSKRDRNDFPLIGDGAAVTVLENCDNYNNNIYFEMHMDGKRGDALKVPAGGFRMPCSPETAVMQDQGDGNFRALDNMHMDGSAVFNFVQAEVPPMLESAFKNSNLELNNIDYFLFHQPNKFMLKKLAEKANLPEDKLPMNLVENYGNLSGASIPFIIALNLQEEFLKYEYKCCLSAFGSGLSWGVMFMNIGKLEHCEIIESNL